jgi:hypothetical protein
MLVVDVNLASTLRHDAGIVMGEVIMNTKDCGWRSRGRLSLIRSEEKTVGERKKMHNFQN